MVSQKGRWAFAFVRLRWFSLSLGLAITLLLGWFATKLTFNFSPDNIYLASDPAYSFYVSRFIPEFGARANVCMIAIDGDIKTPRVQQALADLHRTVEKLDEVDSVRSLVNTQVFLQQGEALEVVPLFDAADQARPELIDWAKGDPMMQNLLVGKDNNVATVLVRLPLVLADQKTTDRLSLKIKAAIAEVKQKYPELEFYLTGTPVLQQEAITTLKHDQLLFVPLVVLLMAILLWFSFRNWRGVLLPFVATGTATIWAMGWLVVIGHPLDIVNNKLVVLLLVIGTSCAVQMFARFQDELANAHKRFLEEGAAIDRNDIVARTVRALVLPCLLTTVTAAIGFGAVVVSKVGIIRHFGIDAAVGVMGSYITTFLFVPALLRIFPLPRHAAPAKPRFWHRFSIDRALGAIARFSMRRSLIILGASVVVILVGAWIAKDMTANQRLSSELPAEAPAVRALEFIEKHLTGVMPFEIVFEANPALFSRPDVVRRMARLEGFAASQPLKPTVRSMNDLLLSFERSLSPGQVPDPVSKWSDEKISQVLLLFEMADASVVGEAKEDFLSKDRRLYRIQGLLKDANTEELGAFRESLMGEVEKNPIPGVKAHLTGAAMISANALSYTIYSMIASLGLAILSIFLLVLILLRSFRFAFIALFPNLVPIVTTVAAMQLLGISLRVATVMTFSMALGIAVDACLYLIARFREEALLHPMLSDADKDLQLRQIIERTMRGSGRPVVYTTLMLLAGFSALGISRFAALRDFAILSSITLSTALVVDLLLWPALVIRVRPKMRFINSRR